MKVGIFSPYLDTLTGGEKYIFTAASCLSREHQVTIFWDDPSILDKAAEKFNLDLSKVKVIPNLFSSNTGLISRLMHTMTYDRIFYLSDGSIPIVLSKLIIHFQFPVERLNTNSFLFLFKKSRISKIVCNSYFTKQFIDRKFNINSYVLYPPSTQGDVMKEIKKDNLILTVGRFSILPNGTDFKKLEFLVSAFKKFQKKRLKGWKMAIVTSVNKDQEENFLKFEKQIKSSHISVYKNPGFDSISSLYKRSKIYWHAAGFGEDLQKFPERAEHFGISTVEAMSYGSIPIVIKAGGQIEIVKDNENGFLWDTEVELIEKTHKIAVDKELQEKLSSEAISASANFSETRFCEELNHLIW